MIEQECQLLTQSGHFAQCSLAGEMHPHCHLRKHLYGALRELAREEHLVCVKRDEGEAYKLQECAHLAKIAQIS
jgi:hypothetical protein